MARKVLIISSSPRRGGNSDLLCDRFMEGAREAGLEVEKVFLKDLKINYCTGCNRCYNGEHPCPQRDDAAGVLEKMVAADVIVMATPVYFYTMDAQMKTLIDRTVPRYTEMTDKEFYYLITAADTEPSHLQRTIEGFRGFAEDCLDGAVEKGIVYGTGAWHKGEIQHTPAMQQAYDLGRDV